MYVNNVVNSIFLLLIIPICITSIVLTIFRLSEKHTGFSEYKYIFKQVILGVGFGILSAVFSLCSTRMHCVCVDGALFPIIMSGFIFGIPAGTISGVVGALAVPLVFYESGISTMAILIFCITFIISGLGSGLVSRFAFSRDSVSPFAGFSFALGLRSIFCIVLMHYYFNNPDAETLEFLLDRSILTIVIFAFGVFVTLLLDKWIFCENISIGKRLTFHFLKKDQRDLVYFLQISLFMCFVVFVLGSLVFFLTYESTFSSLLSDDLATNMVSTIEEKSQEVKNKYISDSMENLRLNMINGTVNNENDLYNYVKDKRKSIITLTIVDKEGKVESSSSDELKNYGLSRDPTLNGFFQLKPNLSEDTGVFLSVSVGDISPNRSFGGMLINDDRIVLVEFRERGSNGLDAISLNKVISSLRSNSFEDNIFPYMCIVDANGQIIISSDETFVQRLVSEIPIKFFMSEDKAEFTFDGENYTSRCVDCIYGKVLLFIPEGNWLSEGGKFLFDCVILMQLALFAVVTMIIYRFCNENVLGNLYSIDLFLNHVKRTGNIKVDQEFSCNNRQFNSLFCSIQSLLGTIKKLESKAKEHLIEDLEIGRVIQQSSLPQLTSAYTENTYFEIWTSMKMAKEVGGDFYDFYFVNEEILMVNIADVSGKGIPAAMFMMKAKTLIKEISKTGASIEKVAEISNIRLFEANYANMFVTSVMGQLNLRTGLFTFVNAGHTIPILKRNGGKFEFLYPHTPNFVLAAIHETKFASSRIQLLPGDVLFFFTDGITEAMNGGGKFYSEERLLSVLNLIASEDLKPKKICDIIDDDVRSFMGGKAQFDDMTMLCLEYKEFMKGG